MSANIAQTTIKRNPVAQDIQPLHYTIRSMVRRSADNERDFNIVTLATGICKQILEECRFPDQRKNRDARMRDLVLAMEHGQWIPAVSTITFAELPDGSLILVNGYTRCYAAIEIGRPLKTCVSIAQAKTMDDVRAMYAKFDAPTSARNDSEMLSGLGVANAMKLKAETVKALYRALPVLHVDFEMTAAGSAKMMEARSRTSRLETIQDWVVEAQIYEAIGSKANSAVRKKLYGMGCMAVGLYLLRHQREKAREFFGGMALNDGLRRRDPRACLLADFQTRVASAGSFTQSIQRVAVAWNAFYEGRELSIIKCLEGTSLVIKGTPKGRAH